MRERWDNLTVHSKIGTQNVIYLVPLTNRFDPRPNNVRELIDSGLEGLVLRFPLVPNVNANYQGPGWKPILMYITNQNRGVTYTLGMFGEW